MIKDFYKDVYNQTNHVPLSEDKLTTLWALTNGEIYIEKKYNKIYFFINNFINLLSVDANRWHVWSSSVRLCGRLFWTVKS